MRVTVALTAIIATVPAVLAVPQFGSNSQLPVKLDLQSADSGNAAFIDVYLDMFEDGKQSQCSFGCHKKCNERTRLRRGQTAKCATEDGSSTYTVTLADFKSIKEFQVGIVKDVKKSSRSGTTTEKFATQKPVVVKFSAEKCDRVSCGTWYSRTQQAGKSIQVALNKQPSTSQ